MRQMAGLEFYWRDEDRFLRALTAIVIGIAALLTLVLIIAWPHEAGGQQYHQHPGAGEHDPYEGYTRSGGKVSCCGGRDCAPAPYDWRTGQLQMPDGSWVDPRALRVAIYFSFDDQAHACIFGGSLVCAFIPGEGA